MYHRQGSRNPYAADLAERSGVGFEPRGGGVVGMGGYWGGVWHSVSVLGSGFVHVAVGAGCPKVVGVVGVAALCRGADFVDLGGVCGAVGSSDLAGVLVAFEDAGLQGLPCVCGCDRA